MDLLAGPEAPRQKFNSWYQNPTLEAARLRREQERKLAEVEVAPAAGFIGVQPEALVSFVPEI